MPPCTHAIANKLQQKYIPPLSRSANGIIDIFLKHPFVIIATVTIKAKASSYLTPILQTNLTPCEITCP